MVIRVKAELFALAGLLSLAACQEAQDPAMQALDEAQVDGAKVAPGSTAAEDCLLVIWEVREQAGDFGGDAERDYDRSHDEAAGGAISCATATSASQFEKTLKALRDAASSGDRAATLAEAGIPLLFIDEDGTSRELTEVRALEEAFDEVFTQKTLERMRSLALEQMTVIPDKGAFFDLGALWLVVPETGARPKLVTVNSQAAAEAAAAAAREAAAAPAD
ncbi:hypothetical protein [Sphingomicrobium astaxanthinifaciens]|uniref:hypothetical protein n=1 Tax=Sphingomicrobium astaxanthinifaciens TaxID=1227949 RepID=UPI001FCBC7D9|nr:hypothetical protein [Sphingomicrobium astaxanthinifaciens]MCJ7421705.1 hypothetical protein [Sphingomicrobium astaxanthinifaciens]